MRRLIAFAAVVALVAVNSPANGQMHQGLKKIGVEVSPGGWKSANHSTDSYRALLLAQFNELGEYDYYYQLKLAPEMNPTFENCTKKPVSAIFGVTHMRTMLIKAGVRLRITGATPSLFADKQVPLLFVGFDSSTPGTQKKGCFFEPSNKADLVISRNSGASVRASNEEFLISITAEMSEKREYALVKRLSELFTVFNAAYSWTSISSGKIDAVTKAADQFEKAINSANDFSTKTTGEFTLETRSGAAGRLQIAVPQFVARSSGPIVFYTSLTASLLLDSKQPQKRRLDPSSILASSQLTTRKCSKEILEKKECTAKSETVHEALASALSKEGNPILFNVYQQAGRAAVFETCQKIRFFATSRAELSTFDALLVRWAALHYFKVPQVFAVKEEREKLAKENGVPPDRLVEECWNDEDSAKLTRFVDAMNYTLRQ